MTAYEFLTTCVRAAIQKAAADPDSYHQEPSRSTYLKAGDYISVINITGDQTPSIFFGCSSVVEESSHRAYELHEAEDIQTFYHQLQKCGCEKSIAQCQWSPVHGECLYSWASWTIHQFKLPHGPQRWIPQFGTRSLQETAVASLDLSPDHLHRIPDLHVPSVLLRLTDNRARAEQICCLIKERQLDYLDLRRLLQYLPWGEVLGLIKAPKSIYSMNLPARARLGHRKIDPISTAKLVPGLQRLIVYDGSSSGLNELLSLDNNDFSVYHPHLFSYVVDGLRLKVPSAYIGQVFLVAGNKEGFHTDHFYWKQRALKVITFQKKLKEGYIALRQSSPRRIVRELELSFGLSVSYFTENALEPATADTDEHDLTVAPMPSMSDERLRRFDWEPCMWTVVILYSWEGKHVQEYHFARFASERKGCHTSLNEGDIEFWPDSDASAGRWLTQDDVKTAMLEHARREETNKRTRRDHPHRR